ncbi:regulatory protein RecX [Sphingomonas solaris]|uniref:Regulatory protein RecX n=1 Tax=Alterirhizorhabdus solaris TaxID=2529389 RepID=A0A558R2V6_9SPHN|nr:RecX family transcriptional regulator [Sphingomonas solaris]TVV73706.1 RecX family transcriptional regulator [Sphingomonas solaris]
MPRRPPDPDRQRVIPPLDGAGLERLALAYVGRYATTRAKLRAYLLRKLGERGWGGEGAPPVEPLIARCADYGYVDDRQFATMRAAALSRRGYGPRRVGDALRAAGVEPDDAAPARATAGDDALATALAYARRRRIGPHAPAPLDPDRRRKALAAMLRAGHDFTIARRIIEMAPGDIPDETAETDGKMSLNEDDGTWF